MVVELAGLDRIAEPMRAATEQYAKLVADLAGPNAKALTLFGALVAGTFDASRHTARSVLVVDRVDLAMLRRLAEQGTKLGKARIAAPLIMTPQYIKTSCDTFPLELIEIKQRYLTLFGEDYFKDLTFDDAHVRLQCERELKVLLIGLRQGLLAAAGRVKLLNALEQDIGDGLMRTLRGILWLKSDHDPKPTPKVLEEIEKIVDRKLTGIRTALDPSSPHGWAEFEDIYRDVEAIGEIADAW